MTKLLPVLEDIRQKKNFSPYVISVNKKTKILKVHKEKLRVDDTYKVNIKDGGEGEVRFASHLND